MSITVHLWSVVTCSNETESVGKKYHFLYHLYGTSAQWGRSLNRDTIDSFIACILEMGISAMRETTRGQRKAVGSTFVAAINQWCDKLQAQVGGWEMAWSTQRPRSSSKGSWNPYEKLLLLKSLGIFSRSQNNVFSWQTVFWEGVVHSETEIFWLILQKWFRLKVFPIPFKYFFRAAHFIWIN